MLSNTSLPCDEVHAGIHSLRGRNLIYDVAGSPSRSLML